MRIGIVRTQVPFVTGGAERHAKRLCEALNRYGHEAVEISLPFKWYPGTTLANNIVASKLIDLSEVEGVPIDLLIGLKFPAYLANHPNKVFWVIHQHRQAYDQWDAGTSDLLEDPEGLALRHLVHEEDKKAFIASPHPIYANSQNVAQRMKRYLGVDSNPLYHPPPMADQMRQGEFGDYLFVPGRLNPSKRLELTLEALAATQASTRLVIAGVAENPAYQDKLYQTAERLNIADRVDWLGGIDDDTMIRLYAEARGVVFVPQDEDYGYISLEAMLSGKPVITTADAGGPLEFIRNGLEGLVVNPDPASLAMAFDQIMQDKALAEKLGQGGADRYHGMNIGWEHVVETLTGSAVPERVETKKVSTPVQSAETEENSQETAVQMLKAAIAPQSSHKPLPFESIKDVLTSYRFDTLPAENRSAAVETDEGLAAYLETHWKRFLSTMDTIATLEPKRILDVGVFPPLVFEAMLVNAFPGVELSGVWEGPEPYFQRVETQGGQFPSFEIELAPANIERDPLPYAENQFDLLLGMEIFEHLALDPDFFLREAHRVLNQEGHIFLSTPNVVSHRGVWKTLNGIAPYSFGIFVPTGGVYGRHNREYAPGEVARLAQAVGFETRQLKTIDVYDTHVDPATAEMLVSRGDDLALRGETIFYLGQKSGTPGAVADGFYHGNPVAMSGRVALSTQEENTGLVEIELENRSSIWWQSAGEQAMCLMAEWISPAGYLVHTNTFLPLRNAIAPGTTQNVSLRIQPCEDPAEEGVLVLQLFQAGVGTLSGTGRANKLRLPCSEAAFLKLVGSRPSFGAES